LLDEGRVSKSTSSADTWFSLALWFALVLRKTGWGSAAAQAKQIIETVRSDKPHADRSAGNRVSGATAI
jgi:hypothetical protein